MKSKMKKCNLMKYLSLVFSLFLTIQMANAQCSAVFTHYNSTYAPNSVIFSCSGNLLGTVYNWDFGDGSPSVTQVTSYSHVTHGFPGDGQYIVCLTAQNPFCTTTYCDTITISTPPPCTGFTASYAHTQSGLTHTFNSTVTGGSPPYSYQWYHWDGISYGTGTGANSTHTYSASSIGGGVELTVTDSMGCHFILRDSVILNNGYNCNGINTTYTGFVDTAAVNNGLYHFNASATGTTLSTAYFWDFGDGTTGLGANPSHQYSNANQYYLACVTVVDGIGCSDTYCDSILPNNPCSNANVSASFTSNVSPAGLATFTSTSQGSISSYSWDFGGLGNSNLANPSFQFNANGNYVVVLNVSYTNGCTRTYSQTVNVSIYNPCTGFSAYANNNIAGNSVAFTSYIYNGTSPYSYTWDFGDGNGSNTAHPTHSYGPASGTNYVSLIVTDSNGCSFTFLDTISYNSACNNPTVTFTHNTTQSGTSFTPTLTGFPGFYASYFWNFGGGASNSGASSPTAQLAPGWHNVCVSVQDSLCSDTYCDSVFVPNMNPCAGMSATFNTGATYNTGWANFQAITTGGTPASYLWDFGDGSYSSHGTTTHHYATAGTFTVTLTVTFLNGCVETHIRTVTSTISSPCANNTASITHSVSGNTATFNATVSGLNYGPIGYNPDIHWFFDGVFGASGLTAQHTFPNSIGTVMFVVMDWDNCYQTVFDTLYFNGGSNPCTNTTASFTQNSTPTGVNFTSSASGFNGMTSYSWDFGNGNTSILANPFIQLPNGWHNVCLTVYDSLCTETFCDSVFVNNTTNPCASNPINIAFSSTIATGTTVNFNSNISGGHSPYSYNWDFEFTGTGFLGSSTMANPSHTYLPTATGGYAQLSVTDSLGCQAWLHDTVYLSTPSPCANTSASFTQNSTPSGVNFTSSASGFNGMTSYYWDFGNGDTSILANPFIQLPNGWHNVCLTVYDSLCTETFCDSVFVNNTTNPCLHNKMTLLIDFDNYAYETSWDIRDVNGVIVESGSGYTLNQGSTTMLLSLCLPTGCYDFNIYDTYGDGICCLYGNGQYQLLDAAGNALVSGASFGYSETTNFCVGGATNPCTGYTASFQHTANNNIITFAGTTSFGPFAQYIWDFGDNTSGTGANPVHTYSNTTASGYYNVCLTAIDSQGCVAIYCDSVYVTAPTCTQNMVTLSLNFDNFAYETSWDLTDHNGSIVYSSAVYTQADNGTTLSLNLCLPSACYDFNIYDAYGDGMCCSWGNGSYSITDANGTLLVSGASFNNIETTNFCVGGANNPCGNFNSSYIYHEGLNGEVFFQGQTSMNTGNLSYIWDFGNGNTSTLANPSFTYSTNGYHGACVTITDSLGCTDTYCDSFMVTGNNSTGGTPCGGLTVDMSIVQDSVNPFILWLQPIVNNAASNGQYYFVWDFGDNSGAYTGSPTHLYNNYGSYVICVMAIDSVNGCVATFCDTITIDSSGNFSRTLPPQINITTSVVGLESNSLDLNIYPNPASDILNLDIHSLDIIEGEVSILDISGKEILSRAVNLSAGEHTVQLPVDQLPAGVFLLKLTSSTVQQTMKFVKGE